MAKLKNGLSIDNETMLKQSDEIEKTIDFMSVTMQNFLIFYKKSDKEIHFSALESIEASLSIIETKVIDCSVDIQIHGDRSVLMYGIENEWMQVWLNLINNSMTIFIEKKIATPTITINITDEKIIFCDNGEGMDMTKESNGLGLNMCRNIISKYSASLYLQNSADGLCATILLVNAKTKS
jgi:nitrogen fixation/metabolism regulation signal transduction histidine kinase